jgi:hypothetical protein
MSKVTPVLGGPDMKRPPPVSIPPGSEVLPARKRAVCQTIGLYLESLPIELISVVTDYLFFGTTPLLCPARPPVVSHGS